MTASVFFRREPQRPPNGAAFFFAFDYPHSVNAISIFGKNLGKR